MRRPCPLGDVAKRKRETETEMETEIKEFLTVNLSV
jgi:hypothetical protein